MISEDNLIIVAIGIISGILADIYRRFKNLTKYQEDVVRLTVLTEDTRKDMLEIKDDLKYLIRRESKDC